MNVETWRLDGMDLGFFASLQSDKCSAAPTAAGFLISIGSKGRKIWKAGNSNGKLIETNTEDSQIQTYLTTQEPSGSQAATAASHGSQVAAGSSLGEGHRTGDKSPM